MCIIATAGTQVYIYIYIYHDDFRLIRASRASRVNIVLEYMYL